MSQQTELIAHDLAALTERAAQYAAASSGEGTRAAYRSAWRGYTAWCATVGYEPLSGDSGLVALYLTRRAEDGLSISSLRVARAAIRAAHHLAGVQLNFDDARLAMVMDGIARSRADQRRRQAAAAGPDVMRRLLAALPSLVTPSAAAPALAARHRAMLLIGFGAALRRSEIVALRVCDVTEVERRGLSIRIRRSKADQHGQGRTIAVWANPRDRDFCPVIAFSNWMTFRRQATDWTSVDGPVDAWRAERALFCAVGTAGILEGETMSDKIVARLIKQACAAAGLDPTKFSGHSLRRGLLTAAGDLQLPLADIMRQSRHKSVETALSYIETGDAWRNNITEAVFKAAAPKEA
jgi:integrase